MDVQRLLLIAAAAALSFMLLTEWVAFKSEREQANAPAAETRLTEQPSTSMVDEVASTSDANADIPTLTSNTDAKLLDEKQADTADKRIITVSTSTLKLAIDLHGGDIIELSLPAFPAAIDEPETPFVLLEQNRTRTYIAQSGLIGPSGIDGQQRAKYTASAKQFSMADGQDSLQVDLHWKSDNGLEVTKRYTFHRDEYVVDVTFLVNNKTSARFNANMFGQIKRDSSKAPSTDTGGMGMMPFLGAATTTAEDRFYKMDFSEIREEPFRETITGGWVAMVQHYFISAWIPAPTQANVISIRSTSSGFNIAGYTSPALVLDPGNSGTIAARFYAGPKDQYRLKEISPYLDLTVDYGFLWWIAQPLFWLLTKIHAVVANWGVAIILLTVLVKLAFYKLSATSYRSMANMRAMQPKMQSIRDQYADDKQKQSQALMELYKKEKINPMGGCLPILVQMPVFIALYWVLMESVELRQAPFMLWIKDLSVMDPYFVLPVLMGATMWATQRLNPAPMDPMQAKVMQWLPVIFTVFFLWFPAGLVLYWVVNSLLSMAQQWYITRKIERETAAAKASK